MAATRTTTTNPLPNFLRDTRVLQIIGQIIFTLVLIVVIYGVVTAIVGSLQSKGITPNFSFLQTTGGFDISEHPEWYSSSSTYWEAFQVGVLNTLRIVIIGLVASTVLGIIVGIFLLSHNYLARTLSRVFVELLRNTPLLVQLFAWYFILMYSLPTFQQSLAFPQESMTILPIRLAVYLVVGFIIWLRLGRYDTESPRYRAAVGGTIAGIAVIEIALRLAATQAMWAGMFGRGELLYSGFLAYIAISLLLIAAAWQITSPVLRPYALGAAVGQLIGGLLFYFGLIPSNALHFELHPVAYINIRGFAFPELLPTGHFAEWLAFVAVGVAMAIFLWVQMGHHNETTDVHKYPRLPYALLAFIAFSVIGWLIVAEEPSPATIPVQQDDQIVMMAPDEALHQELIEVRDQAQYTSSPLLLLLPQKTNFKFTVGTQITPEYMALLLGLTVYTAAFIAEIVRAGIQAVPHGQVEAARALGLSSAAVLSLVILPQALRIIIPPLGNQYLGLTKNSSLATAVAFADIYTVSITMASTSGQSVPIILMVMVTYLIMSLIISAVMNRANRQFQLVTR